MAPPPAQPVSNSDPVVRDWYDFIADREQRAKERPELASVFQKEIKLVRSWISSVVSPTSNGPGSATGNSRVGPTNASPGGTSNPSAGGASNISRGSVKTASPGGTNVSLHSASNARPGAGTTEDVNLPQITGEFSTTMPQGSITQEEADKLAVQVMKALMRDFGLTKEQAAGVVGNFYHESAEEPGKPGMNPHINEVGYAPPDQIFGDPVNNPHGYGWAQWSEHRKTNLIDFATKNGLAPGSAAANYAFLVHELTTTEAASLQALKATKTVDEATLSFRKLYERAAVPNDPKRLAAAQKLLSMLDSAAA